MAERHGLKFIPVDHAGLTCTGEMGEAPMKILAHRGYWNTHIANNSPRALRTALENGYGFESDLRDYEGKLVISHNIADKASQEAEEVFQWLAEFQDQFCFAVNIKSDGLKDLLAALLAKYRITNYFTFDMSVPQMVEYAERGLTYFTRQSEWEQYPVLYENAAGVWVDGFLGDGWITEELVNGHLQRGKQVCLVSPELHGRDPAGFWERLAAFQADRGGVLLCTDRPDEAKRFFTDGGKK